MGDLKRDELAEKHAQEFYPDQDVHDVAGMEFRRLDAKKDFLAGRASLESENQKLREALKIAEGYMFHACQPDQGDLFGEYDEKIRQALKAIKKDGGS